MWLHTLQIARRDFTFLIRHPVTLLWAFVMPVIFFSFIGRMTSGFGPNPERPDVIAVLAPPDAGFLAPALERHLKATGYDVRTVASEAELAKFSRRLHVPATFTTSALAGKPQKITFENAAGGGLGGDYDKLRLQRAVYGLLAEYISAKQRAGELTETTLDDAGRLPRNLQIDVSSAGHRRNPPSGYQQSVPGTLVMFVLIVLLTSGGISIVVERKLGILRRLASSPMTHPAIVLSKWSSRAALAVVQTAVGAALATFMFGIEWGGSALAVAALLGAYVALCTSVALWLGSVARSEAQSSAIGVIAGNILAALGGCWWPIEVSPLWMQKLSILLPTGMAMDGLHRLMSFGEPATAVLPHIAVLTVLALATGWLAARAFRFE
jgi:ABC-type multidrug transport system permease subunit